MTEKMKFAMLFLLLLYGTYPRAAEIVRTPARTAPNCEFTDFNDKRHLDLRQFKGSVVYVDFCASWCGPCAESFQFINNLYREFKDRGLQVLAVNMDENPDDAKQFLEQHPASFSIVTDASDRCAEDFGVTGMPSSYLVDRGGNIRGMHLGFRSGEADEFRVLVEKLLDENNPAK
jgi:peroxiredoxin